MAISSLLAKYKRGLFIALIGSLFIGCAVGYLSGFFYYSGILPCALPPGLVADGMALAEVFTWHDLNGDGVRDANEPPLPWVTVDLEYGYLPSLTGANGEGRVGKFKPGCACKCWQHEAVRALTPPGYHATTPTQVALTGQAMAYGFGFQAVAGAQRPTFSYEPEWAQAFTNRGLRLQAFHYVEANAHLALALAPKQGAAPNQEQLYDDIFNIIQDLRGRQITIQTLSLSTATRVTTCDMATVRQWDGKLSPAEIIETYCQHAAR